MFHALAELVLLPFRLLGRAIDWMGRLASVLLGFLLMVGGAALTAGSYPILGLPIALFGLILTLRALG